MRVLERDIVSRAVLLAGIGSCLGCGLALAAPPAGSVLPHGTPFLKGVNITAQGESVRVVLKLDAVVNYRLGNLTHPLRFYFDLLNTRLSPEVRERQIRVDNSLVASLHIAQHRGDVTRVVVSLNAPVFHIVTTQLNPALITIDLVPQAGRT